jgi:hypothetical protein
MWMVGRWCGRYVVSLDGVAGMSCVWYVGQLPESAANSVGRMFHDLFNGVSIALQCSVLSMCDVHSVLKLFLVILVLSTYRLHGSHYVDVFLFVTVLCCTLLCFAELYCTVLYCTTLDCTTLDCTVLHYVVPYVTALYCVVIFCL